MFTEQHFGSRPVPGAGVSVVTRKTKYLVTSSGGEASNKQTNKTVMPCGVICCEDKWKAI